MKFGTRSALTPAGWESMVALLDPLRLYDLSPESFVSRELMAYAAGLALFRQRLEQCRDDLFLATCSLERLARWEERLDLPVARTDEASRREMAAVKLKKGGIGLNESLDGMCKLAKALVDHEDLNPITSKYCF